MTCYDQFMFHHHSWYVHLIFPYYSRHLPEEAESFEIFEELQPGHPATMARLQRLVGSAPNTLGQVLPATLPRLTVLCRTAQQAEAVLRLPPGHARARAGQMDGKIC